MFTFQSIKGYDCKKCKASCHMLKIPFNEPSQHALLGGDATHCFAKKTSSDYQKEISSPCLENFLRQSQSNTIKPERKKTQNHSIYWKTCWTRIDWGLSLFISFHTILIYTEAVWSSLFPTKLSKDFSTLVQSQIFWL